MHWAWRTVLSLAAGVVFLTPYWGCSWAHAMSYFVYDLLGGARPVTTVASFSWQWKAAGIVAQLPIMLVALGTFAVLGVVYRSPSPHERETQCRVCGQILRGLTAPRCPECGEPI